MSTVGKTTTTTTTSSAVKSKSEASVREEIKEITTTTKTLPLALSDSSRNHSNSNNHANMRSNMMIGKFASPQDSKENTSSALEKFEEKGWKDKSLVSKLRDDFFNVSKEGIETDLGVVKRSDAFEVNIDVTGFQPKDLTVILKDDLVTISGLHEEKSLDGSKQIQRKFERKYTLPPNVDHKKVKSLLSSDGKSLKFEAPFIVKETPVAITYEKKVTMKTVTTRQG